MKSTHQNEFWSEWIDLELTSSRSFLLHCKIFISLKNLTHFHRSCSCLLLICQESLTNVNEISSTLSLFVINKSIAVVLNNIISYTTTSTKFRSFLCFHTLCLYEEASTPNYDGLCQILMYIGFNYTKLGTFQAWF